MERRTPIRQVPAAQQHAIGADTITRADTGCQFAKLHRRHYQSLLKLEK